jgi:3-(3-hydroxy-phenyl)propionate hydroxylase
LLSYQPFLADGTRLDDRVGLNFLVVAHGDLLEAADPATRAVWEQLGAVLLEAADAAYEGWLAERGLAAVVIRPDRYVFGTAATVGELDALTARLAQALGAGSTEAAAAAGAA